eukprot:6188556-Pleurochrysis_carterae.AAC.1
MCAHRLSGRTHAFRSRRSSMVPGGRLPTVMHLYLSTFARLTRKASVQTYHSPARVLICLPVFIRTHIDACIRTGYTEARPTRTPSFSPSPVSSLKAARGAATQQPLHRTAIMLRGGLRSCLSGLSTA